MLKPSLSERMEQQSYAHTQLAQNVGVLERRVNGLTYKVTTFSHPVKTQIKIGLETNLIKQDLKNTKRQLVSIQTRLDALEKNWLKKDVEDKTRSIFWGYVKQALPLLWELCVVMLTLGLTLDDLYLLKLMLGQS